MSLDTKAAEAKMELERDKRRANVNAPMPNTRRPRKEEVSEAAGPPNVEDEASKMNEEEAKKKKARDKEKDAVERKKKDTDFRSGQRNMLVLLVKQVLKISQGQKVLGRRSWRRSSSKRRATQ